MKKEIFYKPLLEVVNLSDDIICTSTVEPESPFDDWDDSGTEIDW